MKYYQQLKVIRKQNRLTQQQLADALGITRSAYCGYEIGRRSPDLDTLVKLSQFYGISLTCFFEEMDMGFVGDSYEFDNNEAMYLSKLTKQERDLIASVRSMSKEDKEEVLDLAKRKVNSKK